MLGERGRRGGCAANLKQWRLTGGPGGVHGQSLWSGARFSVRVNVFIIEYWQGNDSESIPSLRRSRPALLTARSADGDPEPSARQRHCGRGRALCAQPRPSGRWGAGRRRPWGRTPSPVPWRGGWFPPPISCLTLGNWSPLWHSFVTCKIHTGGAFLTGPSYRTPQTGASSNQVQRENGVFPWTAWRVYRYSP